MATDKQLAANTLNARKSTGPRTPKGRARSSKNALKHGLTTRDFVVFERERVEFETFLDAWSVDLRPVGALEEELFAQLTQAAWNMRRVRRAESNMTGETNKWFKDSQDDPITKGHKAADLNHYARYNARNERSFYRALLNLRSLQTDRALRESLFPQVETSQAVEQIPVAGPEQISGSAVPAEPAHDAAPAAEPEQISTSAVPKPTQSPVILRPGPPPLTCFAKLTYRFAKLTNRTQLNRELRLEGRAS